MIEAVLALALTLLSHCLRFRYGWNLADEGFLWNGALRIGQGKIPIRDYKSYDPGRFYWCWAGMKIFGSGLLGLRHSVAVFQGLGLWAGLAALGSMTGNVAALALAGIVLVIWMNPRHKLFDHAMSLIAVLVLTVLIQSPSPATALLAGVATGLAAVMGRNHGVYLFAASGAALILLAAKGAAAAPGALAAVWALGIPVGYAPMLAMFLFVPGMFRRYLHDKVLVFVRRGGIDLALAPPWPWTIDYGRLPRLERVSRFLTGLHFVVLPIYYVITLGWILLAPDLPQSPVLIAASLTGVFYMHHAASRSDLAHLCQVMQPFLIGLLALAYGAPGPAAFWLTPLLLTGVGFLVVRQIDPWLLWRRAPEQHAEIEILGDRLIAPGAQVALVESMRALVRDRLRAEDRLFVAPNAAMLYPFLQRHTPVHSDFLLFPESEAAQDRLITDLERNRVDWAVTQDLALDGHEALRFRNTHAKVWAYLETHFARVPQAGLGPKWDVWQRISRRDIA